MNNLQRDMLRSWFGQIRKHYKSDREIALHLAYEMQGYLLALRQFEIISFDLDNAINEIATNLAIYSIAKRDNKAA